MAETTAVRWEEPEDISLPPSTVARRNAQIEHLLRGRPGEWALIDEGYTRPPSMVRAGRYDTKIGKAMRRRGLRVKVRSMADGTLSTWAMAP